MSLPTVVVERLVRAAADLVAAGLDDDALGALAPVSDALALSSRPVPAEVLAGFAAALGAEVSEAVFVGADSGAEAAARYARLRRLVLVQTALRR